MAGRFVAPKQRLRSGLRRERVARSCTLETILLHCQDLTRRLLDQRKSSSDIAEIPPHQHILFSSQPFHSIAMIPLVENNHPAIYSHLDVVSTPNPHFSFSIGSSTIRQGRLISPSRGRVLRQVPPRFPGLTEFDQLTLAFLTSNKIQHRCSRLASICAG